MPDEQLRDARFERVHRRPELIDDRLDVCDRLRELLDGCHDFPFVADHDAEDADQRLVRVVDDVNLHRRACSSSRAATSFARWSCSALVAASISAIFAFAKSVPPPAADGSASDGAFGAAAGGGTATGATGAAGSGTGGASCFCSSAMSHCASAANFASIFARTSPPSSSNSDESEVAMPASDAPADSFAACAWAR